MFLVKRLFLYLLLCFLVGKVVAEDVKSGNRNDLNDFGLPQHLIQ